MNDNSDKEKQDNKIVHSKCLRCNRPLKDPESQKIGMGKTCLAKYKKEDNHRRLWRFDNKI